MKIDDILAFLAPQAEPLQLTFFLLLAGFALATIVATHRTARPASWERKWNRGTPDDASDDLDIEHGSVTDLWHAVATAPEKLADIMPGMLLVIGLLGTFLGLGMALNQASTILGHADLSDPRAASDSMQSLLGMLQGLGTKFKTSTWGILGFVVLKVWSEVTRFEEKRMTWVIGKVKVELEARKRAEGAARDAREQVLFGQIGGTAQTIVEGFATQVAALIAQGQAQHAEQLAQLGRIEQSSEAMRGSLAGVEAQSRATSEAMTRFTEGTQAVVANMDQAAGRMAAGADKVGAGASQLVDAIKDFEQQFTGVLDNVRADLGAAINNMSAQASKTLETGSAQLSAATGEISAALGVLSRDVKETMQEVQNSINGALDIQRRTAMKFVESTDALNEKIAATTMVIEKMTGPIDNGLRSVSDSSLKVGKLATGVQKSAEQMEQLVAQLDSLPEALRPLASMQEEQAALLSMLKPLAETVKVQQAMLALLQEIGRDRASSPPAAAPSTVLAPAQPE